MGCIPFLFFSGNCNEAIKYYKDVFDGDAFEEGHLTYADVPKELLKEMWLHDDGSSAETHDDSASLRQKIFYAELNFRTGKIALADSRRNKDQHHTSFAIELGSDDLSQAKRWYDNFVKHGQYMKNWEKTFWAEGYGIVLDKFDIEWRVRGPLIVPAGQEKNA